MEFNLNSPHTYCEIAVTHRQSQNVVGKKQRKLLIIIKYLNKIRQVEADVAQ